MAKIKFKSYIKSAHGRLGNLVYYNVRGRQYARAFSMPRNPRTEAQQRNRASFALAVRQWQKLPEGERARYNSMAKWQNRSGYNIFISMAMKGTTPAILKLINHTCKAVRLLPGYITPAGTSVIYSSYSRHPYKNMAGPLPMLKKPPGKQQAAA